jgi:sensor histidine kinase YesM
MAQFNSFFNKLLFDGKYRIIRHLLFQFPIFMLSLCIFGTNDSRLFDFQLSLVPVWLGFYAYLIMCWYVNIYVLTPRYLLNGRILKFTLLALLLIAPIAILRIMVVVLSDASQFPLSISIINFLGNTLTLIFLMAAPTSLALFRQIALQNLRNSELQAATAHTELQMLKQQINPHFLFNMINNVNVLVRREPEQASALLFRLEDLIRYQLADSNREQVNLQSDIQFLRDFLDLEKVRRSSFRFSIDTSGIAPDIEVPPLLFIPFVENAVKHNSDGENESWVNISFSLSDGLLTFVCQNSKPPVAPVPSKASGIGLKNISRRLELLYGNRHTLSITDENSIFTVRLTIALKTDN